MNRQKIKPIMQPHLFKTNSLLSEKNCVCVVTESPLPVSIRVVLLLFIFLWITRDFSNGQESFQFMSGDLQWMSAQHLLSKWCTIMTTGPNHINLFLWNYSYNRIRKIRKSERKHVINKLNPENVHCF